MPPFSRLFRRPPASLHGWTAIGIVGCFFSLDLLIGCAPQPGLPGETEAPRVLLIGMDGLDPGLLSLYMDAGRLPTFAALREQGIFTPLASREPILSPLIWTTIATGRKPQDHGILDFVEAGPDGEAMPITSRRRQVPALWDFIAAEGLRSGFLGWYATYPAETVNGFQVSDRIGFHQVRSATAGHGVTFPEELAGQLEDLHGGVEVDVPAASRRFAATDAESLTPDGRERIDRLAEIYATAEYFTRVTPTLLERFRPHLFAVYFELVDACGHLFMENAPPRRPEISEQDFTAFSNTVLRCYEAQDELLARLLRHAGPDTLVVVVSDHGFKSGAARPETSGRVDGVAGLWHRLHGTLMLKGPTVRAGAEVQAASILDIAPTLAAYLDVPVPDTLAGRVLDEAFASEARPELRVEAEFRWQPVKAIDRDADQDVDPSASESVAKLQALGYLGSSRSAFDDAGRTSGSHVNEGISRMVDGDSEGALRAFSRALSVDPHNVQALTTAAGLSIDQGELARAETLLQRAEAHHPNSVFVPLHQAQLALALDDRPRARQALDRARRLDANLVRLAQLEARWANAEDRPRQALDELLRAETLTDSPAMLLELRSFRARIAAEAGLIAEAERALRAAETVVETVAGSEPSVLDAARGDLALAQGRFDQAAGFFRAARARGVGDPTLPRKLAQALASQGRLDAAESVLREALDAEPRPRDQVPFYGDLAELLQQQGRDREIVETLQPVTEAHPEFASLWFSLGAAHGRLGDLEKALSSYERSVALEENPLTLKTLAMLVLHLRDDRPRATALLRRSLVADPSQDDVRALLGSQGSERR